jgi:hypothetical protein
LPRSNQSSYRFPGCDRVLAQPGFFTIHPDETPLDEASPRWVRRVDIPEDALAGARDFLALTAAIALNHRLGRPPRNLTAYYA